MALFAVPGGWVVQAYKYALDPAPAQERSLWSHAGAARFARNHMLGLVKAALDQRAAERSYGITENDLTPGPGWSLPALRRAWNQRKDVVAPWWAENSKEAYNTGLDSLARSLETWSKSRTGQRAGAEAGFPRFRSKRGRASVRFTTGTIRVEADRHHVTLPRLGTIRTHESTRKLARRVEAGTARILSATATRDAGGRWFVSFQTLVQRTTTRPAQAGIRHPVVGVDLGVKAGSLMVVGTPALSRSSGCPHPRAWLLRGPGCAGCSARPLGRSAPATQRPGASRHRRTAGGAHKPGSGGPTPVPRTCAPTHCTRRPPGSPSNIRSSSWRG